jgi:dihydrofolate synthase/folylpolyglutamate synthase
MTYQEVLDYLFQQFPQYQKIGGKAFKPGLDNIRSLCNYLGNPQDNLQIIHVAGTNGKGSTCSMLASILKEEGYTVGLFTSPHIVDFSERIRINGTPIAQEEIVKFVTDHKTHFDQSGASFFEWSLSLALAYFKQQEVDYVILETGLGGRLDATNVVTPILAIITSIGIDHTQYLGTTIHEITKEKAGIIKSEVPVVTTMSNPVEAIDVIKHRADEMKSQVRLAVADDHFESDLKGDYQRVNKGVVLMALETLGELGIGISEKAMLAGFKNVVNNAGLRGRWEVLQTAPTVIADIGHNYEGVKEIVGQLAKEAGGQLHMVWGMVEDKEISRVVNLLPKNANYYLAAPQIQRGLDPTILANEFQKDVKVKIYPSVTVAYEEALSASKSDDLVFIGGSTFVVAEIISDFFLEKPLGN